jgi:hypothetical protein
VARAQQPSVPVIGYVGAQSADEDHETATVPFLLGLKETGYVEPHRDHRGAAQIIETPG